MPKLNTEEQMKKSEHLKDPEEKTLQDRLKLHRLVCDEKLLEEIESYGDKLMDLAVKQNRVIQTMKRQMKK